MSKVIAGIVTAGAIGGATVGGYYAFNNYETITNRLKEEGYEALNVDTEDEWTDILAKYQKATSNTFEEKSKLASETTEGLRSKCKDALSKKIDANESYLLARQWCVKERTVSDILEKQNFKILKVDATSPTKNEDDQHWEKKAEAYATSKSTNKIEVKSPDTKPITKDQIITACKELNNSELKTTTDGFNKKLEQVKEWCAVKKNSNA